MRLWGRYSKELLQLNSDLYTLLTWKQVQQWTKDGCLDYRTKFERVTKISKSKRVAETATKGLALCTLCEKGEP